MFHGGLDTLMQMIFMTRIAQDEEFNNLCAAQIPAGGWRRPIANAMSHLHRMFHAHQPVTQIEILSLTRANQALEARIVELEHQLATLMTH